MQKGDSPARGANGGPQGRPRPTRRPDLRRGLVQRVDKQRERKEHNQVNSSCTTGTSERRNSENTKKSSLSHTKPRSQQHNGVILFIQAHKELPAYVMCQTSSGSRDPLGERAQIEFVQRLASEPHPDRHQNRPRNAFETRVDLRESGFGVRDLPITANSATERIGRRREVHQLGEQTTSRGENGSAESTERGASAGAARCPHRAGEERRQAHSYALTGSSYIP